MGVDAGVIVDKDGNARPGGSGFEIGAYEWWLKVFYSNGEALVLQQIIM